MKRRQEVKLNDYKIYKHNRPVKPRVGRKPKYWHRMLDLDINESFFVETQYNTMKVNVYRYHKTLEELGSKRRFNTFKDSVFKCKKCKEVMMHSQLKAGWPKCIFCGGNTLKLVKKGCSVQRVA